MKMLHSHPSRNHNRIALPSTSSSKWHLSAARRGAPIASLTRARLASGQQVCRAFTTKASKRL
eukprot:CAMPEP_0115277404 /NCGR_PEP_ID=MMETSP0270-20121206/57221_1 /TAXON_ID=71861 /ORGANISM="Scrippsiella trochoidea, Strain CCMP3099" /LENGTH=62 /DNA_ID=CAMNT_0002694041 /DNA_START=198 /DNA_END=383 /DNA_ORIENTATION=+